MDLRQSEDVFGLNDKVKGQDHQGQTTAFCGPLAACV